MERGCRKPRAITCGSPKATTFLSRFLLEDGASGFSTPSGLQHSFHQQLYRRFPLPDHTEEAPRQISQTQTDPIRQPFLPSTVFLCPRNTIYNAGMALVRRSALPADDNYPNTVIAATAVLDTDRIGSVVYLAEPSTTTGYMTATPPQNRSSRDASTSKRSASSKKPSDS